MKATLEFNMPMEGDDFKHAKQGARYHQALRELLLYLDESLERDPGQVELKYFKKYFINKIVDLRLELF